jgi:hypothetical protein
LAIAVKDPRIRQLVALVHDGALLVDGPPQDVSAKGGLADCGRKGVGSIRAQKVHGGENSRDAAARSFC